MEIILQVHFPEIQQRANGGGTYKDGCWRSKLLHTNTKTVS